MGDEYCILFVVSTVRYQGMYYCRASTVSSTLTCLIRVLQWGAPESRLIVVLRFGACAAPFCRSDHTMAMAVLAGARGRYASLVRLLVVDVAYNGTRWSWRPYILVYVLLFFQDLHTYSRIILARHHQRSLCAS